ncbi:MAG: hypothetical protein ACXU8N_13865 [Telluria sp.]
MHTEDLKRKELKRDMPTHPHDPAAAGDADKVVNDGGAVRTRDYNDPPPTDAGKSMGQGLDPHVGGAGLGRDPEEQGSAEAERERDLRADDVNDRRPRH